MEIVERYLQATKFWLPSKNQQDIIDELSEGIRCELEARELEAGHRLDNAEVGFVLKRKGSPLAVAQRYLSGRYLIGPMLLPVYLFVIKIYLYCWVAPWIAVWIGLYTFDPTYRAAHQGRELVESFSSLWLISANVFLMTTAAFAILRRFGSTAGLFQDWNPRRTRRVRDLNRISRTQPISSFAGSALFALWWTGVPHLPAIPNLQLTPAPMWRILYWPILIQAAAIGALALVNLAEPHWTKWRTGTRLLIDSYGLFLVAVLLRAVALVSVAVPGGMASQARDGERWANVSVQITLVAVAVQFGFQLDNRFTPSCRTNWLGEADRRRTASLLS